MAKKTQKAIEDAFVALLADRPMDKITVLDVCEASGVSRSTFYYHYHDMLELLEHMFRADMERFLASDFRASNWSEILAGPMDFAMRNKTVIYHIYTSLRHDALEKYLFEIATVVAGRLVRNEANAVGGVPEEDIVAVTNTVAALFVGLTFDWLRHGLDEKSAQGMAKIETILDGFVRSSFRKLAA